MYVVTGYYLEDCGKSPFTIKLTDVNDAMEEFDKKQSSIDIEYVKVSDADGILAEYGE